MAELGDIAARRGVRFALGRMNLPMNRALACCISAHLRAETLRPSDNDSLARLFAFSMRVCAPAQSRIIQNND